MCINHKIVTVWTLQAIIMEYSCGSNDWQKSISNKLCNYSGSFNANVDADFFDHYMVLLIF